jgi:acid phosphatase
MSAKRTLHLGTAAAGWLSRVAVAILATNVAAMTRLAPAPKYDHILIVMMENHSFDQIFTGGDAPYLRSLAMDGAVFTESYAVTHPTDGYCSG